MGGLVETEVQRCGPRVAGGVGDGGDDDVGVAQHGVVGGGARLPMQQVQLLPHDVVDVELLAQALVQRTDLVAEAEPAAVAEPHQVAVVHEGVEQVVRRREGEARAAGDRFGGDSVALGGDDLQHP